MLAVAMNGTPLPIEHGFPVRTIVPGLYGYVSACKWVVEMEVTSFDEISAYWTDRGWSEMGPVKIASRDRRTAFGRGRAVRSRELRRRRVGTAHRHPGRRVLRRRRAPGRTPRSRGCHNDDTWVQWKGVAEVEEGDHTVRVRAIDKDGQVQTGVEQDVLPDGATGWHTRDFSCT